MIPSKISLVLLLAIGVIAQDALSPTECVIACVDLNLASGLTDCVGPRKPLDATRVPCLCEDFNFMKATVDCVLNTGRCKDPADIQRSFVYARGLCDSAGVNLPGNSASELPSIYNVSTSASSTTIPPTPVATVIDQVVTTNIIRTTSITCPMNFGNATYIVMKSNTTYTKVPEITGVRCGNITETFELTFTKPVISTYTPATVTTGTGSMAATGQSTSTAESGGALKITGLHIMTWVPFAGVFLWFF